MIVYHGSIITVDSPDVQHSYRPLDFGKAIDRLLIFKSFREV